MVNHTFQVRNRIQSVHICPLLAIHSLQGALGKTAGRSYKAAPRQLLQVDTNGATDPAHAHGHISKEDAKEHAAGAAKEAAQRLGAHSEVHNGSAVSF